MKTREYYRLLIIVIFSMVLVFSSLSYSKEGDPKKGKRIYTQYCVPCHGKFGKGEGTRGMYEQFDPMPRNHTNGKYMNKRAQEELFSVIKNGGKSKNFSHIMPPWKTILNDDEIWDVLMYVRSLAVPAWKPGMAEEAKGR